MWYKENNNLTVNYTIVRNPENDLHLYVSGASESLVKEVSNDLVELLNFNKKSKNLRKQILVDEVLILENNIKIGVAGAIRRADSNSEDIVNERSQFLKDIAKKF